MFLLRGVFVFCLFLCTGLFTAVCGAWDVELRYEPRHQVRSLRTSMEIPWRLTLTDYHELSGVLWASSAAFQPKKDLQWRYVDSSTKLRLFYGSGAIASGDPLRVLHRSSQRANALLLHGEFRQVQLAVGRDLLDARDSQYNMIWLQTPAPGVQTSFLLYRMPWQWERDLYASQWGFRGQIFENSDHDNWQLQWGVAYAWQRRDAAGVVTVQHDVGAFLGVEWQGDTLAADLEFLYMPAGLASPLGAHGTIPSDRIGWRGTLEQTRGPWHVQFNIQDMLRYDGQREYVRRWWQISWGEHAQVKVALRRQPQPNFIVSVDGGPSSWQWNHGEQRFSWTWRSQNTRLRLDAAVDARVRWELRWGSSWQFHMVHKYHGLTKASQTYAAWSRQFSQWSVTAAYGTYDRGHLGTRWDTEPSLTLQIQRAF